jgi:hypothetical protein
MQGDWITAVATVIGAVIGIIGTLLVEYFRKERKSILFVIDAPEDLAEALRSHGSTFELKVNNVATQTLNAAGITVQNVGNIIIRDLTFDVTIPGEHLVAQAQAVGENPKLVSAVKILQSANPIIGQGNVPYFTISLPYLNPGETFKVTTFYDGSPIRCTVDCRLPGVRIKTVSQEDLQRSTTGIEEAGKLVAKVSGVGAAGAIAAATAAALASLLGH